MHMCIPSYIVPSSAESLCLMNSSRDCYSQLKSGYPQASCYHQLIFFPIPA